MSTKKVSESTGKKVCTFNFLALKLDLKICHRLFGEGSLKRENSYSFNTATGTLINDVIQRGVGICDTSV